MTIYEIADAAGVSPSTVSRVLNGKPGVKKSKRELILRLLQENNFNLKQAQQAVPTKCSRVIGIVVPDIHNVSYMDGAHQLACFLDKSGFSVIVMNAGDTDQQRGDSVACLSKRGVEAAILIGSKFESENVRASIESHLSETPIFTVNATLDLPNVYCIVADEGSGVEQCVNYLYRRGRRRMLLLLDNGCPSSTAQRAGFEAACGALPDVQYRICDNINSDDNAKSEIRLALAECSNCDAIISSDDMLGAYALRQLHSLGYEVPEQISLISIGNTRYSEITNPRLTSLNSRQCDGCMIAGQELLQVLNGEEVDHHVTLTCDLIIREST